jgi:hypothetical protein
MQHWRSSSSIVVVSSIKVKGKHTQQTNKGGKPKKRKIKEAPY